MAGAGSETLSIDRQGRVALVTFRRGDQLNAMNRLMQGEIIAAFEALSADPEIGAIVVTGAGRAFMAGADIKEYAAQTGPEFDAFQSNGTRMYAAIEQNAKPVIAAVNGFALGGGFELVLCCDLVIASDQAKFGLPEIKLGLVPGGGGTQRSVQKLGRNQANFLLLTGAIVPASALLPTGLINELTEPEQVVPRAMELATMIAAEPPAAIEGLKRLTALALEADRARGLKEEQKLVNALYRSDIGQSRVQAFAQKSADRAAEKARAAGAAS
jgi:enoyl-CoA hydratase/carnithine racemase